MLSASGAQQHQTQNKIYIFIQSNDPLGTAQIPFIMPTISRLVTEAIRQSQISDERTYVQQQRSTFVENIFMKSCTCLYFSDKDVKQLITHVKQLTTKTFPATARSWGFHYCQKNVFIL